MTSPEQITKLAPAVRAFLAQRFGLSFEPVAIAATLRRSYHITPEDAETVCQFLEGLGEVKHEMEEFGTVRFWTITPAGLVTYRRRSGGLPFNY